MKRSLQLIAVLTLALPTTQAQSPKHLEFPSQVPGPPFYAQISDFPGVGGEYYHTAEWAAVVFHRQPSCVPPNFNLLDGFDVPAAFGCPLTIRGFEIWPAPPPEGFAPIEVRGSGLGAVPIYFVSWSDLQIAVRDRVLTITELESLPSLKIGFASTFNLGIRPGVYTQPGIEMSGRGLLQDGRQFEFEASAGGPSIDPKHVKIVFR
jgi:hypothetical protein